MVVCSSAPCAPLSRKRVKSAMEFNFPSFSTNSVADEDDEEEDDANDSKSLRDDQESRATTTPIFFLLFLHLLMLLLQLATDTLELSHSLLPRPQEKECANSNNLEEEEEEAEEECSLLLLLTRLTDMLLSMTRTPKAVIGMSPKKESKNNV